MDMPKLDFVLLTILFYPVMAVAIVAERTGNRWLALLALSIFSSKEVAVNVDRNRKKN